MALKIKGSNWPRHPGSPNPTWPLLPAPPLRLQVSSFQLQTEETSDVGTLPDKSSSRVASTVPLPASPSLCLLILPDHAQCVDLAVGGLPSWWESGCPSPDHCSDIRSRRGRKECFCWFSLSPPFPLSPLSILHISKVALPNSPRFFPCWLPAALLARARLHSISKSVTD